MVGIPRIMGYPSVEDDIQVPLRRPEPAPMMPQPAAPEPEPELDLPPALLASIKQGRMPRSYEDLMPAPKDTTGMDRMLALGGRLSEISSALGQNRVAGGGQEFAQQLAGIGQKQRAAEQAYAKDKMAFDTGEQDRVAKLEAADAAKAQDKATADQLRAFYASKGVQIPEGMSVAGMKALNPSLIPKPLEAPKPLSPLDEKRMQLMDKQIETMGQSQASAKLEGDVQKLADKVGVIGEGFDAIAGIEKTLGFPLEAAAFDQKGELLVGGKKVDLPGVSIPGIGRVTAYSGKARELADRAAKIFNTELKDRSGAAVTSNELDRLKGEFSQGKFNTEPELIRALADYKRALGKELKRREAAFRPEVVQTYGSRGGTVETPAPNDLMSIDIDSLTDEQALELDRLRGGK